jgi:hypothetical protein
LSAESELNLNGIKLALKSLSLSFLSKFCV